MLGNLYIRSGLVGCLEPSLFDSRAIAVRIQVLHPSKAVWVQCLNGAYMVDGDHGVSCLCFGFVRCS